MRERTAHSQLLRNCGNLNVTLPRYAILKLFFVLLKSMEFINPTKSFAKNLQKNLPSVFLENCSLEKINSFVFNFLFKFNDFYFTGKEQKRIDLKALTSVEGKKLLMSGLAGLVLCLLCLRVAFRVSTRLFRASSCRKRECKSTVC